MVILDDDTVVDKNGKVINNGKKEEPEIHPVLTRISDFSRPDKFISNSKNKNNSE